VSRILGTHVAAPDIDRRFDIGTEEFRHIRAVLIDPLLQAIEQDIAVALGIRHLDARNVIAGERHWNRR
jgi:hypothetical protein